MADLCNKVGMIEKGKLLVSSDVDSLLSQLSEGTALEIRIHDGVERAKAVLEKLPDVGNIDVKGSILKIQYTGRIEDIHNILTELVNEQIQVSSFHETALDLEDAFLKLTEGTVS